MEKPFKHVPGADKPANYGHFSSDGLSYIVTTPETPRPWNNILGNHAMAGLFSQCGQGFIYYLAHSYEHVTNWREVQYCPGRMSRGRLVFLKERNTGKYWAANPQPGESGFSKFSCTHEPGVSTIRAIRNKIDFSMRAFIPWDEDVEIWTVTLRNLDSKTRHFSAFPLVEFPTNWLNFFY